MLRYGVKGEEEATGAGIESVEAPPAKPPPAETPPKETPA